MNKNSFYQKWRLQFDHKTQYYGWLRDPYYQLATNYLPNLADEIAIDIGAGNKGFAQFLDKEISSKFHLLDGNPVTIEQLKKDFKNAKFYLAPSPLPYESQSVSFVHCSHLIEHLNWKDLEAFLHEISRVLKPKGVLILSTPLHCDAFYGEFSHVRPYYPEALRTTLCTGTDNSTADEAVINFEEVELVYRYASKDMFNGIGSSIRMIDFFIMCCKRSLRKFGILNFEKTGYTQVLRKLPN
jgi:SAM-dependent methyltransferase